ncbi:DUF4232 domain-containing protein [Streptacidiphilus sp. P02-A3a]|uniref:DUF4232 domain-containing protein n=1 Tax=Streptacidiphilus sp. P02-A3a TaxID=2704468 RepID=UPI0015FD8314|nr:DUF4232 domain-containing protein [Streptacidiphilus sp. P02-A3a]QMU67582.1 DUF4232 domain-containing protein [Streptacidiphilus sp. P02-A3a]
MRMSTLAVGAMACTAVVLGSAPAMAASSDSAAAKTPMCATSQLTASLGGGDAGAGNLYRFLLLTNHSHTSCQLDGYPGLSLLNAHGQEIGAPATFDHNFSYAPVTLRPGQAVSDTIHTLNSGATSCQGTSTELRIYPPGNKAALVIPGKVMLCGNLLSVTPFGRGTTGNPPDGTAVAPISDTSSSPSPAATQTPSAAPTNGPSASAAPASGGTGSGGASAAPTSASVGVVPSGAPDTGVPVTDSSSDTGLIAGACAIAAALFGGLGLMLRRRSQARG